MTKNNLYTLPSPHYQKHNRFCGFYALAHALEVKESFRQDAYIRINPLQLVARAFWKIYGRIFNRALGIEEAFKAINGCRVQARKHVPNLKHPLAGEYRFPSRLTASHSAPPFFPHHVKDLIDNWKPVIFLINNKSHAVVITGYDDVTRKFNILDSQKRGGYRTIPYPIFEDVILYYYFS